MSVSLGGYSSYDAFAKAHKLTRATVSRQMKQKFCRWPRREADQGQCKDSRYNCWAMMIQRCANTKYNKYHNYGGRGVRVCGAWYVSFLQFGEDMGPRPGPEYSVERIDVNGNYEPGNCRWATLSEQARNTRKHAIGMAGVRYCKRRRGWVADIKINGNAYHLGIFTNKDDAAATRKVGELVYWSDKHEGGKHGD